MSWFPVGPTFVYEPRKEFKRLSRRNERGTQGLVAFIAIDPTNPATLYTVDRAWWGGRGMFRSDDDGESWTCISDSLTEQDHFTAPICLAINPAHPETIFVGTGWNDGTNASWGIYVSNDHGDHWTKLPFNVTSEVNRILIDPRTAADRNHTLLVVGAGAGLHVSTDSGSTWQATAVTGGVTSLVANFPQNGIAEYYAAVRGQGVFYTQSNDPTLGWQNLNLNGNTQLPSPSNGAFDEIMIDLCQQKRVYAWHLNQGASVGLYTTASAMAAWSQPVAANKLPGVGYWWYFHAFAVAPNSPGDGKNDILFATPRRMSRSIDSGVTWVDIPDPASGPDNWFHEDGRSFAFAWPKGAKFPYTYHGCDGGMGMSTRYADPSYKIEAASDFNEGLIYDPNNGIIQNYNHGKQCSAIYVYNSHRDVSALGYIGCQDTGAAGGGGAVWRTLYHADVSNVACAPGSDGVTVFVSPQIPSNLALRTDRGTSISGSDVTLDDGGALLSCSDQIGPFERGLTVAADDRGYAGVSVRERHVRLLTDVAAAGVQSAKPESMRHIHVGTWLGVENEAVLVSAVDNNNTSFQAEFAAIHPANTQMELLSLTSLAQAVQPGQDVWVFVRSLDELATGMRVDVDGETLTIEAIDPQKIAFLAKQVMNAHAQGTRLRIGYQLIVRLGTDGIATQVSQNFNPNDMRGLWTSPLDPDLAYCLTDDGRLWMTQKLSSADSGTQWSEVTSQTVPRGNVAWLTFDAKGVGIMLRSEPATVNNVTTPLFRRAVNANDWEPLPSAQLPGRDSFNRVVGDPLDAATLYAARFDRVYRVRFGDASWIWSDISAGTPAAGGLPKQYYVSSLWIANIKRSGAPKVLLRAAIHTRGVWEVDVSPGAPDPTTRLYVRANVLDDGWLDAPPGGARNPFDPSAVVETWQCSDVKVDRLQSGQNIVPDFYQTDPEGTSPVSPVQFELLHDHTEELTVNDHDVMVHVQVHNRSLTPAAQVRVWVLYVSLPPNKALPGLDTRTKLGQSFDFWSQFLGNGHIVQNLPIDSAWKSIGLPATIAAIDAAHPAVVSWKWTLPVGFYPNAYCLGIFVHCAAAPLSETETDLTVLAARQRQVGQRFFFPPVQLRVATELAYLVDHLKRAVIGVGEGFAFFVDPLFDPPRGMTRADAHAIAERLSHLRREIAKVELELDAALHRIEPSPGRR